MRRKNEAAGVPAPARSTHLNSDGHQNTAERSSAAITAAQTWDSLAAADSRLDEIAAVVRHQRATNALRTGKFGAGLTDAVWHEANRRLAVIVGPNRGRALKRPETTEVDWDELVRLATEEQELIASAFEQDAAAGLADLYSGDAFLACNGYLWDVLTGAIL